MDATDKFYTEVLGFVCESRMEGWALVKRDGVGLIFTAPNDQAGDREPAFTGSLYFSTDPVDELWLAVKDKARVCYPIETFAYNMREFGVYDNNGYLLQFGQPVSGQK